MLKTIKHKCVINKSFRLPFGVFSPLFTLRLCPVLSSKHYHANKLFLNPRMGALWTFGWLLRWVSLMLILKLKLFKYSTAKAFYALTLHGNIRCAGLWKVQFSFAIRYHPQISWVKDFVFSSISFCFFCSKSGADVSGGSVFVSSSNLWVYRTSLFLSLPSVLEQIIVPIALYVGNIL